MATAELADRLGEVKLLDVRESDELESGTIPTSQHVARGFLELKLESLFPDRGTPIVVYCAGGNRSLLALETMSQLGYTNLWSLEGGFNLWRNENRPVERTSRLASADRERYRRHLVIPQIGEVGQAKLLSAKVFLVGAGGLGSPVAYYLAAAGVGTIGIVDSDVVELSNLQRQILHSPQTVGVAKTESARRTLSAFSPNVILNTFAERLTADNISRLTAGYDVIVDGSDNFTTRYLINDFATAKKIPFVHGSVFRFEGHAAVFRPGETSPCYRCLFPEPPPPSAAPNCAEAGVLGVLPGVVGLIQATETIKLLLGIGELLTGRLLRYDALRAKFTEISFTRAPDCPAKH